MLVSSAVLGGGAYAATTLYGQFGAPRTAQSRIAWADRQQIYLVGDCRGCHGAAAAEAADSPHERLLCESCHVPTVAHPGPIPGVTAMMPAATSEQCIQCHSRTPGKPSAFAQVAVDSHYAGADCLACHDPHSSGAIAPRPVTHPLANLPECTVCHSAAGLKQFPSNHQVAPDTTCLACHRQGASGVLDE